MLDRCLVVGTGSIGQRHIGNLRALGVQTVECVEPSEAMREAARALGAVPVDDLGEALQRGPQLVLVCTPPHLHLTVARLVVAAGAHVFVEKPIAPSLDGVEALLAEADRAGRIVAVGYMLRFEDGIRRTASLLREGAIGRLLTADVEFGQYLPDWRPNRDYRATYTAQAVMGGGILLDASHEINYLEHLAGPLASVSAVLAKTSDLQLDVEDTAVLLGRTAGGAVVTIRLDCVQRRYVRRSTFVGSEGTIRWSLDDGVVLERAGAAVPERFAAPVSRNAMYVELLRDALDAARTGRPPGVTGRDAARTLQVVEAARRSACDGRLVSL